MMKIRRRRRRVVIMDGRAKIEDVQIITQRRVPLKLT